MDQKELENKMKEIAEKVFNEMSNTGQFKLSQLGSHTHNGLDSQIIKPTSIQGFSDLNSFGTPGVLAQNNYSGGTFVSSTNGNTFVYPLPFVQSGMGIFNGGQATDGTLFASTGGAFSTTFLWILIAGTWYGFKAATTA